MLAARPVRVFVVAGASDVYVLAPAVVALLGDQDAVHVDSARDFVAARIADVNFKVLARFEK